jgi:CheY-like chemotaxis protein
MERNMTKIMLVEDDKSLREIYGVRLLAEGYDIVSAGDGEEALAMAIKERPQLIVSDVMMPKISGFDMLDILRSTTETKNIKVIMMTALSSEEQRQRGESLGADRYLVKSQVGIEDVVRVVHEVLEDGAPSAAASPAPAPAAPAVPQFEAPPAQTPAAPVTPSPLPPTPQARPAGAAVPPRPAEPPKATAAPEPPKPASIKTRVIQPLNDPTNQPADLNQLLDKELAKEAGLSGTEIPTIQTTEQEKQALEQELANFTPGLDSSVAYPSLSIDPPASDNENGTIPPPPPPPPGAPNA